MGAMSSPVVACPSCGTKNRLPVAARGHPRCAKCKTNLPWLVDAGDTDFAAAIDTRALVVVDLWAPWCGPCRMIAPVLDKLSQDMAGKVKVVKVNVDEAPAVSARLGVQGIPTMLLFVGGAEVGRQVGALPGAALRTWIDQTLAGHTTPR